ncbi:hypothetical protein CR152_27905 [Massilia violaceinigra]|uniref:DUF3168 domain-containing protein n=1 Tax=Massilia violaceinigra TaxID=2045208 RepID=A0A2D2DSE3_9BURK|nr:DUF3168 domain-containing protein [Massilia violaceinigra]ATQ77902.1 hypothetical protein CR152_27905 [Massilia violaceinigra]
MSMELMVFEALQGFVKGDVYPDFAPEGTPPPYITFQAVGGDPINFLDGGAPSKERVRVQVSVWASTRVEASSIGKQAENALRVVTGLQTTVVTGRMATFDEDAGLRGTMQDFEFFT